MFSEITSITLQNFSVFTCTQYYPKLISFKIDFLGRRHEETWPFSSLSWKRFWKKNHGAIRTSLHHQNGHAKSRDTVLQFAKSELTKHVITGGYMHLDNDWWALKSTKINACNTHPLAHLILNISIIFCNGV